MTLSRRELLVGLGSALGLAACTGQPTRTPSSAATPAAGSSSTGSAAGVDWASDLDALVKGIESTHPNPWWREPRAAFLAQVETLKRTLPTMDRRAQEVAVMELVATIDGHTAVYPTDLGWHCLLYTSRCV